MEVLPTLPNAQRVSKSAGAGGGIVFLGSARHGDGPGFLRDTLSKLNADTERDAQNTEEPAKSDRPSTEMQKFRGDLKPMRPLQVLSARTPSKNSDMPPEPSAKARVLEQGALSRELERFRGVLRDDMKIQFLDLKDSLLSMTCRCGMSAQREVEQLRDHCEKLLQTNVQLRQNELNGTLRAYEKQIAALSSEFTPLRDMLQSFSERLEKQERASGDVNVKLEASLLNNVKSMVDGLAEGLKNNLSKELQNVFEKEHHPVKEEHKRLHTKVTTIAHTVHESRTQQEVHRKYLEEQSAQLKEFMKAQEALKDITLQTRQRIEENEERDAETRQEVMETQELSRRTRQSLLDNEKEDEMLRMRLEQNEKRDAEYQKRLELNEKQDAENLNRLICNEKLDEEYRERMEENEERDRQLTERIHANASKLAKYEDHIQDQERQAQDMTEHMHSLQMKLKDAESIRSENMGKLQKEFAEAMASRNNMLEHIEQLRRQNADKTLDAMNEVEKLRDQLQTMAQELQDSRNEAAFSLTDKLNKLRQLERRGNICVNLKNGEVELKREIPYIPKMPNDGPVAQYANEEQASSVISDIAELWKLFQVEMTVEGHTKDLGVGPDKFWKELADNRAALCVSSLSERGVDTSKVISKGRPGKTGMNTVCVIIKLDIFPDID